MISIRDLAKELGRHPNKFHEFVKKHKFPIEKIKSDNARGQMISMVSEESANEIRNMCHSDTATAPKQTSKFGGYFYIIQLEPVLEPNRVKLGYTLNVQDRLRKHQCSAPNAKLLQTWECRALWEKTIIDIVTISELKMNRNKIDTECFVVKNLIEVVSRINKFFDLTTME